MKFDFAIGNPPYQEEARGSNESDTPVYHFFYDEAYKIADKVELITPARFLFNAGGTPKEWNEKMLSDEHLKVEMFCSDSSEIFTNTNIMGGVAVTYRDVEKKCGAIGVFTPFEELNSIKEKVESITEDSLAEIISNRGSYRYSDKAYEEQPNEMTKTADRRIAPSAFERMPLLFRKDKPNDEYKYTKIYGNVSNERVIRWFRREYISYVDTIDKFKVLVPKANGSKNIGSGAKTSIIGNPILAEPNTGFTETYISVGCVDRRDEAEAIYKYVKTKFARTMLGILKVTQNNARPTWQKVPLQDFTSSSDIDWSVSIPEIDKQLYKKYGLSEDEIEFIETNVKEME